MLDVQRLLTQQPLFRRIVYSGPNATLLSVVTRHNYKGYIVIETAW